MPARTPLLRTSDNPKDIIFDAFLADRPIPSLTCVSPNRLSLLLKALALSGDGQPLLEEEKALVSHFVQKSDLESLENFLYQKLMHGYLQTPQLYEELVSYILNTISDVSVGEQIIRRLPLLTQDVWSFIWTNSTALLDLIRELVVTSEEASQGLHQIFSMLEEPDPEIQKHAISLIAKQLYTVCSNEIEAKALNHFEAIW